MRLKAARGLMAVGLALMIAGAAAKGAARRKGSAVPTPIWAASRNVIWDGAVGGPVTADGVTDAPAEAKIAPAAPPTVAAAAAGDKKRSKSSGKKKEIPAPVGGKAPRAGHGDDAATATTTTTTTTTTTDNNGDNPLLDEATRFPRYADVRPEHVGPAMRAVLAALNRDLDALEAAARAQVAPAGPAPSYSALMDPLERMADRLERTWGVVGHLKGVRDSAALRAAVAESQPDVVAFELRLGQSRAVYEALKALKASPAFDALTPARRRAVELQLRDLELGGVALDAAGRERFNRLQLELAEMGTKFSNNVLDATSAFKKVVVRRADVEGLPESALARAASAARDEGHGGATASSGPWVFTIDGPSYVSVITYAKNRALREEMYRAYNNRASAGATDNTPVIERLLALRRESARLLGFDNFAEYSMATKMATLTTAGRLLDDLSAAAMPRAAKELEELRAFAKAKGEAAELQWWDVSYWAERLRAAKYELTEEELKPYLSLPSVLDGMFKLAKRLFGVEIVAADGQAQVWHPDVRFFEVRASNGTPIAHLYLDPFARPSEKRGGAWMDSVIGRSALLAPEGQRVRLPVAVAVCNQAPPAGPGAPALMTVRDVTTLFHEFGHTLQHMLTDVDDGLVAGIRGVSWDAVEVASQFMENWAMHRPTLETFARHHATGAPMPDAMFKRIAAAANFRAATGLTRQVNFASKDLELYSLYVPGNAANETIYDVEQRVAKRTLVMPLLPDDRSLCSFGHIMGSYAAGYYSYKWSEVMSADAFAAFEEAGLDDDAAVRATGRRYASTILGLGGGVAPAEVFRRFRGRDPTTAALLRHSGLAASS